MATTTAATLGKRSATVASDPSINDWQEATLKLIADESPTVKTLTFQLPRPVTHLPGQHYELRLTAENGYQAARLYSAASLGEGSDSVGLTIMRVPDGEVSPYVVDSLAVGDKVEIRGPFGHFFTWSAGETRPILLIGGGSGIIPLHAMREAHMAAQAATDMRMLYSEHSYQGILYKNDLLDKPDVTITLTQEWPADWGGETGRITLELLERVVNEFSEIPLCYVCGMNKFVTAVADGLQEAGIPMTSIKTERFG